MNRMPQPGEIYQHYKGKLYRIVTLAEHTESGEQLAVYQALYGSFQVYAQPLSLFLDEVDHEKHPDVQAKLRFTLVPALGGMAAGGAAAQGAKPEQNALNAETVQGAETMPDAEARAVSEDGKRAELQDLPDAAHHAEAHAVPDAAALPLDEKQHGCRQEEEFQLDPGLLAFLEADSYEKKLEVYASLDGKADASILNTIAVSLDLELSGDTLEEQYDTLKNCLLMLEKYECNRLR